MKLEFLPLSLITAFAVQGLCQLWKVISAAIKNKTFNFKIISTSGGMPSSHSAFVTALCISIGIYDGFRTGVFAVSAVFAAIVIHDSYRVRGSVQQIGRKLNRIIEQNFPEEKADLPEMVGHTVPEIIVGVLCGAILAFAIGLSVQYLL